MPACNKSIVLSAALGPIFTCGKPFWPTGTPPGVTPDDEPIALSIRSRVGEISATEQALRVGPLHLGLHVFQGFAAFRRLAHGRDEVLQGLRVFLLHPVKNERGRGSIRIPS